MTTLSLHAWHLLSEHLDRALQIADSERDAWLAALAQSDPPLALRLRELLRAREHPDFVKFLAGAVPAPDLEPQTSPLTGRCVGPYVIETEIGRGGMGSVWRARRADGRYQGMVAIKFVHASFVGRAGEQRFRLEGNLLARLNHPNIARLLDAGVVDETPYLVLEYVEGEPIDAWCNRRQLTAEARVELFLAVIAAVSHAHSHLIVHRDIKPANVLVTPDGTVKLLDFGVAKLVDAEDGVGRTKSSVAALTPQYAAPEQLLGQAITTATDVYALGLVAYVLLTGAHPHAEDLGSNADLMQAVLTRDPPRASATPTLSDPQRRALAGDLDNILGKALKKVPAERYASADAFADDLRRFLTHEPVQARPDTIAYRVTKFTRRHRGGVTLAALAMLAGIAGATGTLVQAHDARRQRDFAFGELSRAEALTDLNAFLLSDAAPSGKPFTVNDLLNRAVHVVERQQGAPDATRVEIMTAIGVQYVHQEEIHSALPLLQRAYQASRGLQEPATRSKAACALGLARAFNSEFPVARHLVSEGLAELPKEPQFALNEVFCLQSASTIARVAGDGGSAVNLAQNALGVLRASRFDSELQEFHVVMDVAESLREAGRLEQALPLFEETARLMARVGRDDTQSAGTLYNNWALAVYQSGRPRDAEPIYRRALDLTRADTTDQSVSPTLLNNYAAVLRSLGRIDEATDAAERAHDIAQRTGNVLAMNHTADLMALLYLDQNDTRRAAASASEFETYLRDLPPGHYAFAMLYSLQARLAAAQGDFASAIALADRAVSIGEAAKKSGAQGASAWTTALTTRALINIARQHPAEAETDAAAAVHLQTTARSSSCCSLTVGTAYLVLAQALQAEGKTVQMRQAAQRAADQFAVALGTGNPKTRSAEALARPP